MFYLTTSRPYTNATPHLGTAIDVIYADCLNRFFKRLFGHSFWSMGTDEHSFKIVKKAEELQISPQEFVDAKYQEFDQIFKSLDCLADNFVQSSSPKHKWFANLAFEKLLAKDLIYKKSYEGLYCTGCEDFYSGSQLIDGKCPIHTNLEIQKVAEENYFFRLTTFKEKLLKYLGQELETELQTDLQKKMEIKLQDELESELENSEDYKNLQKLEKELFLEKQNLKNGNQKAKNSQKPHKHGPNCNHDHDHQNEDENPHSHTDSEHSQNNKVLPVFVPDESVLVEMINFAGNLQDISISRQKSRINTDWGVPIESDKEHLMYVWFEALLTYLTPLIPDELWQNWENANLDKNLEMQKTLESEVWELLEDNLPQNLQIIGRDNAKFHLIIWPSVLFGLDLEPIESCLVHGMITDNLGRKFAKSLGNGVELEDFLAKMGMEGVRFFVLHDCNSVGDTSFDWTRVIESYNSNLANNLGNLVVRITNLVEKFMDGFVDLDKFEADNWQLLSQNKIILNPNKKAEKTSKNSKESSEKNHFSNSQIPENSSKLDNLENSQNFADLKTKNEEKSILQNSQNEIDFAGLKLEYLVDFNGVYQNLFDLRPEIAFANLLEESTRINRFLENTKPWSLGKNLEQNQTKIEQILTISTWNLLQIGRVLSVFLPQSGAKIVEILTEIKIKKAEIIFPKIELEKIENKS